MTTPKTSTHYNMTQTLEILKKRGYVDDYSVTEKQLKSPSGEVFNPADFQIDETYRFDVLTDPDDQSVLYAISSPKRQKKGVLINGFGIYADSAKSELTEDLRDLSPTTQGA